MKSPITSVTLETTQKVLPNTEDKRALKVALTGLPAPTGPIQFADDSSSLHGKVFAFKSVHDTEDFLYRIAPTLLAYQAPGQRGQSAIVYHVEWDNGLKHRGNFPIEPDGLGELRKAGVSLGKVTFGEYVSERIRQWAEMDLPSGRQPSGFVDAETSRLDASFAQAQENARAILAQCSLPSLDDIPPGPLASASTSTLLSSEPKDPEIKPPGIDLQDDA